MITIDEQFKMYHERKRLLKLQSYRTRLFNEEEYVFNEDEDEYDRIIELNFLLAPYVIFETNEDEKETMIYDDKGNLVPSSELYDESEKDGWAVFTKKK